MLCYTHVNAPKYFFFITLNRMGAPPYLLYNNEICSNKCYKNHYLKNKLNTIRVEYLVEKSTSSSRILLIGYFSPVFKSCTEREEWRPAFQ